MRTIHRYDPEDIDFKDPIHGFVMAQILVTLLTWKGKEGEAAEVQIKRQVAAFLNAAADSGIAVTKSEIPAAFTA